MTAPTPPDDLQFTTAEPTALTPGNDASTALLCAECAQPIGAYYFTVAGRTMCSACKEKVERALAGAGTSRTGRITKALVYGFGAALVGAAIWYGVAVVFNVEIGLVAILIGWMVGRAVRIGSGGRGGRRYQVAAALLTYLSVAMSYGALGYRELDSAPNVLTIAMMFVLPIVANLASMPGGLIGIAILAFGIYRAWQMNAAITIPITGPHRIGGAPAPAA